MKLPEAIKMAVEDQDWYSICAIYTGITGLPLQPPKPKETDWANLDIDISPVVGTEVPGGGTGVQFFPAVHIDEAAIEDNVNTIKGSLGVPGQDQSKTELKKFWTDAPEANDHEIEEMVQDIDNNRGEGEPLGEQPEVDGSDCIANSQQTTKPKRGYATGPTGNDARIKGGGDEGEEALREGMLIPDQRINRFQDDPNVLANVIAAAPSKPRPTKKRQAKIDVVCSNCHKAEAVAPLLARGYDRDADKNRYRCNKCITSRPATR